MRKPKSVQQDPTQNGIRTLEHTCMTCHALRMPITVCVLPVPGGPWPERKRHGSTQWR